MSKSVCDQMAGGMSAAKAVEATMANTEARVTSSKTSLIVIDSQGCVGAAPTTAKLAQGRIDGSGKVRTAVDAQPLNQQV